MKWAVGSGQWAVAVLVVLALAGCGSSKPNQNVGRITLSSPDLRSGSVIPRQFTCDGGGARPRLQWSDVPSDAVELAVLVGDPDAPGGTFVHWTVWGLSPKLRSLSSASLPAGAREGANSGGSHGWTPPCPPRGDPPHHYEFAVYALSKHIGLTAGEDSARTVATVRAAAIATGSLTARYSRR